MKFKQLEFCRHLNSYQDLLLEDYAVVADFTDIHNDV